VIQFRFISSIGQLQPVLDIKVCGRCSEAESASDSNRKKLNSLSVCLASPFSGDHRWADMNDTTARPHLRVSTKIPHQYGGSERVRAAA